MARREKNMGLIVAILFHLAILGLLFKLVIVEPEEEPEGISVNFGFGDTGGGATEPTYVEESSPESSPETATSNATEEELLTQDTESPMEVNTDNTNTDDNTSQDYTNDNVTTSVETEPKLIRDPKDYLSGLNSPNNSTSQGENNNSGNQGQSNGDLTSTNYTGGGIGNGVNFDLAGRSATSLPAPTEKFSEEGVVVVKVWVNKSGKVIRAEAGVKGSNTYNSELLRIAKNAALKASFNSKSDAPIEQTGTITYNFKLR